MPDPTPPREGAGYAADENRKLWKAIRDIKSASGTQRFGTVEELGQWRTYVGEESYDHQVTFGDPLPWAGPIGAEVEFVTTSPRQAKVEFSVYVGALASHDGSSPAVSPSFAALLHFAWGGAYEALYSPYSMGVTGAQGSGTAVSRGERISYWDVVNLRTPGRYRVGFVPEVTALNGTSGFVRFQNPRISVQILGPIEAPETLED